MKRTVRSLRSSAFCACALLTVFSSTSPALQADPLFPAPYLELGQPASSVAVADFNRDGLQDVAVAFASTYQNTYVDEIAVFLGQGKGEFSAGVRYKVVPAPFSMKVGDFDADGKPDLAVLSYFGVGASVLLNAGDGTLKTEIRLGDPADYISSISLADFNGDSRTDLISVNPFARDLSLYLSNGDGTFAPARRLAAGNRPQVVEAGDFNRDGRQDLLVTNLRDDFFFDDALVMRGDGRGYFEIVGSFYAPLFTDLVASADINGDGADDVALGTAGGGFFSGTAIYLSRGDDTFEFIDSGGVGGLPPTSLAFGDLNADTKTDLAFSWLGSHAAGTGLSLGNGDGTLRQPVLLGSGNASVAIGDLDPDGRLDLISADLDLDAAVVRPGNGDGTFGATLLPVGSFPRSLVRADFNADGKVDLVVANPGSGEVSVLLGLGDGHFRDERRFGAGAGPRSMAIGDFDHDGRQDLATVNAGSHDVSVLSGLGDGSFSPESRVDLDFGAASISFNSIAAGDFNRDGVVDLAVVGMGSGSSYYERFSVAWILLGHGDGTFTPRRALGTGIDTSTVVAADFNGDQADDLVALDRCGDSYCSGITGKMRVFPSLGDGTFGDPSFGAEVGYLPYSVASGDFDGDGHRDLVVASGNVTIFLGDGDGTFARRVEYPRLGAGSVNIADFNADGTQDISVGSSIVILSNGDGTFETPLRYLGVRGLEAVSGDFNNDGRQDLAGLRESSLSEPGGPGYIGILLNTGPFPVRAVSVDVKPGVSPNYVNAYVRGVLPVAVLGAADFDASMIDPATVILHGSGDASPAGGDRPLCHLEDVNGDGEVDLLCQFRILDLALRPGEATLVLEAKTYDGQRIRGEDRVRVIGRRRPANALRPLAGSTRPGLR